MTKTRAKRRVTRAERDTGAGIGRLLRRTVHWSFTGDAFVPYQATVGAAQWRVRVNDFPDHQMYTLLVDGRASGSFDDWPASWERPSLDPVVFEVRRSDALSKSLRQLSADLKRRLIHAALTDTKGNTREVARRLGIDQLTVARALKDTLDKAE